MEPWFAIHQPLHKSTRPFGNRKRTDLHFIQQECLGPDWFEIDPRNRATVDSVGNIKHK